MVTKFTFLPGVLLIIIGIWYGRGTLVSRLYYEEDYDDSSNWINRRHCKRKSTVSQMFRELSIPVIDADIIAREVVERGKPAYNKIVEVFGTEVLQEDGELDRPKLGSVVFYNEENDCS